MPTFHPKDTTQVYRSLEKNLIDHLGYNIHYFQMIDYKHKKSEKRLKKINDILSPSKKCKEVFKQHQYFRHKAFVYLSTHQYLCILRGKLIGKLLHGMGSPHVRETSLTIHPVYGVPYIPASSIKGSLRNWVLHAFFDRDEKRLEQDEALTDEQQKMKAIFYDLFGSQESQGFIQFHDAFASEDVTLKPDVMTVHFREYYDGNKPATDDQNPLPIAFYTVESSYFEFIVTIAKKPKRDLHSGYTTSQLIELTQAWLSTMLEEHGIGSKTATGYGYFNNMKDVSQELISCLMKEIEQEKEKKQKEIEQRKQKLAEEKRQQEIEEKLAQMTPAEKLVFEIESLTEAQEDQQKSKNELYEQVLEYAEEGELAPAKALKEYWQTIKAWKVKKQKKKQFAKVKTIKAFLQE